MQYVLMIQKLLLSSNFTFAVDSFSFIKFQNINLEIVESSRWQQIITVFHESPGPVSHAHHDHGDGVVGGLHQSLQRRHLLLHLAVSQDQQDVELPKTGRSSFKFLKINRIPVLYYELLWGTLWRARWF